MIVGLRILFAVFFLVMLGVTIRASLDHALWAMPGELVRNASFITTLTDLYLAFFTVYLWVWYKERALWKRGIWFLGFVFLGSFAISAYCLWQLCRVPAHASIEEVLLRDGSPLLGGFSGRSSI